MKREIIGRNSSRSNQEQATKDACLVMNQEVLVMVKKENKRESTRRELDNNNNKEDWNYHLKHIIRSSINEQNC